MKRSLRLTLLLALLAAAAYPAYRALRPPGRWNVLVVLVDTLRADRLGAYGHSRDTSPVLDALAADGTLFEECFAPAPWTIASTATLLTGLEPFVHGFVRPELAPLSAHAITLAEVLRGRGFRTAAFSGNLLVGKLTGFDQGFDTFETVVWSEARGLNERATKWLDDNARGGRFFLYMHYFDPHDPYADPEGIWKSYAGLAAGEDPGVEACPNGDIEAVFQVLREGKDPGLSPADLRRLADRYDGEIRFADGEIGKLLAHIRSLGVEDETLVVFVSDHGEQFLEHGGLKHGSSLHREELHVPLVFRVPGARDPGERRADRVGLVDVFPTVLSALGIELPGAVDGRDLFRAEPDPDRIVFSETSHGWATIGGKRKEGQVLLAGRGPGGRTVIVGPEGSAGYPRVYEGPGEAENVSGTGAEWEGEIAAAVARWRAETAARVLPNRPLSPEEQAEIRERLIQLGYVARPKPLESQDGDEE